MEAGNRQLSNGNGTGFIKTAEKLKKELERIPLLVREYEEKAEELSREIRMAESGAAKKQGDLKPQTGSCSRRRWRATAPIQIKKAAGIGR